MSARYGGPRGPHPNYPTSQASHDPFVNPSQQQFNDQSQRTYDTESDVGDHYGRRETYISDGSIPAFNDPPQPSYDQYNYDTYRACHLPSFLMLFSRVPLPMALCADTPYLMISQLSNEGNQTLTPNMITLHTVMSILPSPSTTVQGWESQSLQLQRTQNTPLPLSGSPTQPGAQIGTSHCQLRRLRIFSWT